MQLKDNIDFYGVFSFKSVDCDGNVLDEYTEKNLIMDKARTNMAQLVGGVTVGDGESTGLAINQFVLGTRGHIDTNILSYQKVGESDATKPAGNQSFDSTRERLFSETIQDAINYRIPFDVRGGNDVTVTVDGQRYETDTEVGSLEADNTVRRVVADRTVTYTFTIPIDNANSGDINNPVVAYTEAALYAGDEIFSMKTFPARVKENSVKFIIEWSIIF